MRIKVALVAFAMAGGLLAATLPAIAEDAKVSVEVGHHGIAFGYTDGYWDREHAWHEWRDRDEANRFRTESHEHFFEWKHDRDHDEGWRENDKWWDRH